MALLTIFTAPKPFKDPHIRLIQSNALRSWQALGADVEILVLGEEEGLAEAAAELGLRHLPQVQRNTLGTPLVSSLFQMARENSASPLLAYVNADILLLPEFVKAARSVAEQRERFLIVGQRWDLNVTTPLEFSEGWADRLRIWAQRDGELHRPLGSDYFIYPRACFETMPAFAIGRAGWDNWMIYHARCEHWAVVDATQANPIIHQDHDYSHLPGGQPHYRLPETGENIRLAGGRRVIFNLPDADQTLLNGKVQRQPLRGSKLAREIEIFPLIRLRSRLIGQLFFSLFHPGKAWGELRGWMQYKIKKIKGGRV